MKILFNVYPLGSDLYVPSYKSGVYRVVEQLALNLVSAAADPAADLQVTFHAVLDLRVARRYFDSRLRGPGTSFSSRPWQQIPGWLFDAAKRLCLRTAGDHRLALRALRWAATRGHKTLSRVSTRLSRRAVQAADIYHSPFAQIPAVVYDYPRLRRFTTIYDLIPLTHPEYFEQGSIETIREVVGRLGADDFVTCISHATRDQLLALAPTLRPERVFVTHLAAGEWCRREDDPARLAAARALAGLPPEAPYFLSLCTLEPRKNLEMVIRAFARLRGEGRISAEHRLVLVGNNGWKTRKILEALEDARHCRDAIVLTGFVPDEQLPALYSGALAFVYLSRLEGFGLPPLEAMQCGAPVVTANTSSLPEVVGGAGLMVDPDDLDGLCSHLLRLVDDEAWRRELSARSLARAKLFSWERFGAETLAAYRTAMTMQP